MCGLKWNSRGVQFQLEATVCILSQLQRYGLPRRSDWDRVCPMAAAATNQGEFCSNTSAWGLLQSCCAWPEGCCVGSEFGHAGFRFVRFSLCATANASGMLSLSCVNTWRVMKRAHWKFRKWLNKWKMCLMVTDQKTQNEPKPNSELLFIIRKTWGDLNVVTKCLHRRGKSESREL